MSNPSSQIEIFFEKGTLLVENLDESISGDLIWLNKDHRCFAHRCHAYHYRELIRYLYSAKIPYADHTPQYNQLELTLQTELVPFKYQTEAAMSWGKTKKGIIGLPTGSGKSFLAALIIEKTQRSTLILTPTIDLILQWQKLLQDFFKCPIGLLGGGSYEVQDITVSTYDSARIHAERLGNRFCLLVFDECHHLPSQANSEMARSYIAPYRLGLTATPELDYDKTSLMYDLTGNIVFAKEIRQLSGDFLAPYEIITIEVDLSAEEQKNYDQHRNVYLDFRQKTLGVPGIGQSWEKFVMYCYRSEEGTKAYRSFLTQRQIALNAEKKFDELSKILIQHNQERVLIFTNDNRTAYLISSFFLLPLITHETKAKERKEILSRFKSGKWPFLVNSRVLNEGMDVPEAGVAVIISGTGTVREHVQRLGRILRRQDGKKAFLYELVTAGTGEIFTSKRRREHSAYDFFP